MIIFNNKKNHYFDMSDYDVSVTCHKTNQHTKMRLRFSFSEKAVRMLCGNELFALAGIDNDFPNRIYFCKSKSNGYKLAKSNPRCLRYNTFFGNITPISNKESFVGYYKLEYDALQSAVYIDKNNKMR